MRTGSLLLIVLCLAFDVTLRGQESDQPARRTSVLVLGMYHFDNPGRDVVKVESGDVLSAVGQQQVSEVITRLRAFAPTKIAIEAVPESQGTFDSLYAAYRSGTHQLTRNERQQIGFRLARELSLPRVSCVDMQEDLPFDAYIEYIQENDPDRMKAFGNTIARVTAVFDSLHRAATILQILRHMNDPAWMAFDHSQYVGMPGIGTPQEDVGANVLATWYDRNVRIFSNIVRIAEPGDRILVIYGGGHATILRDLIRAHPSLDLIDTLSVLGESSPGH